MRGALASGPSSNRVLNYQLRLTSATGVPVADGAKNVKLTFYSAASGGTQLYSACSSTGAPTGTPTAVVATFASGQSSILIGSALTCASGSSVAIPATLFDNAAIFLGVTVESDAEMTPRKRIVAAGYALNADKLDDLDTSAAGGSNAFVPVTDPSGNFTLTQNVTLGDAATDNIVFNADINSHAIPNTDDTFDLGSTSQRWRDLYLGPATLHIGTAIGDEGALTYNTATNVLNIDSTGTVDINGGSGSTGCSVDAAGNFACTGTITGGSGGISGSGATGQATFWTGTNSLSGDNAFFWDNGNKRLGIGTASPSLALDVLSTGAAGTARFRNNTNAFASVDIDSGATAADFSVVRLFDRGTNKWELRKNSANNFDVRDASVPSVPLTIESGTPSNAIYVRTSTGNVGIGTSTASEKLQVAGNGRFGNISVGDTAANFVNLDTQVDGNVLLSSNLSVNDLGQLVISNTHATDSGAGIHIPGNGRPRQGSIEFWTTPTGAVTAGNAFAQSSPRVVIDNNGSLGIGDATPASMLTVGNGDLFQVNSSGDLVKIDNVTYNWPSTQGAASTVLTNDGAGNLTWSAASSGTVTGTGAAGRATFWTGASTVSSDAAFFWDNANKRLGIGNAAPSATLNVTGDEVIDAGSSFFGLRINGTLGSFGPAILLDNGTQSWGIAAGLAASDFIITKSSGTSFTPFTIKNTGFDNEMVLGTNGVGINTASPNDLLEVVGAGTAIRATDGSVVTRLFSSSATGLGYVGTNSANGFALRTGGTDQFTIDTNGDLFPAASGQSIIFPAQAGDNTSGEIIMFNGCCSNGRRAIIGHSPGFPDWGLSYDDTGDDFYFATQLTATPDLAIDMGGAAVYVGSTVTGTGASLYRATTGRLTGSQANGVQFDGFGTAGIFVEDAGAEGGGFFANGNTAAIWSPGDSNGVLSVYDEDFFSGATPPTAEMRVQSGGYLSTKSLLGGGSTLCYTTATFTGYNTLSNCVSSRRYKENIAPLPIDTGKVLQLQPVKFTWKKIHHDAVERNGKTETPAYDEQFTGPTVGLIAEDVAPLLPDIITYKDGQVEGIEYKLLSVYELAVLKKHEADIEALKLGAGIAPNGTMTVNELDADVVKARVFYVRNSGANKTAGTGVIPPGAASIMVQNANVDAKSLLSVTFKDDPGGSWWIGEQAAGSFMVHVSAPAAAALHFTYWIVGLQDGVSP